MFRTASIGAGGASTGWTTVYDGPYGDARGSTQGRIPYNEFLGDYVYAIATRTYGAGVWDDVRDTADCPAMDGWRQDSLNAGHRVFPAPWALGDCRPAFGNNDIYSATTGQTFRPPDARPCSIGLLRRGRNAWPAVPRLLRPGDRGDNARRGRSA